jgi:stress-induced morphogen
MPDQITPEYIQSKIQKQLNTSHILIEDMSGGCGQAFNAIIVSSDFQGKTLLQRSRVVNAVLKEEIKAIHAWTPRCLTPDQWEREQERTG